MTKTRNGLNIEVYSGYTDRITDPGGLIPLATGLQFSSGFPGGLYLDCSFYVPRRLAQYWDVRGAQRVVIRNGQRAVYEGKIENINSQSSGGEQGTLVQCIGYWGALAMRYQVRKNWADKRITEDVWMLDTSLAGAEKCTIDRQGRIRFTPKAVAWIDGNPAGVKYIMPIGQTAKRVTYSYALAESAPANDWEIYLQRSTDGSSWTSMTNISGETYATGTTTVIAATGTGNIDVTLATPSRYLRFLFVSRDAQTPPADGTIYGEFSNITVYSETGTINAYEVSADVIGLCPEMSTSLTGVADGLAAETLPVIDALVFDEFTPLADILTSVAGFGNTSDESIYFQMRASEEAETNDGYPLLSGGIYPDLTVGHYVARMTDENVVNMDVSRDYSTIRNWITVSYTDERGEQQIITPDDAGYTALTDAVSTAAYGRRVDSIQSGTFMSAAFIDQLPSIYLPGKRGNVKMRPSSAALALYFGKRYLAKWKNPIWRGSITVQGYIYGSSGNQIPASEIEAGKVLDLADYLVDEVLASDTLDYPRVILTATSYDAETEQCVLTFGPLDDLQMMMVEAASFPPIETPVTSGGATGGKAGNLNWKRRLGIEEGSEMWAEAVKLGKAGFRQKYPNWKKPKG